jgi:hypothetical protein
MQVCSKCGNSGGTSDFLENHTCTSQAKHEVSTLGGGLMKIRCLEWKPQPGRPATFYLSPGLVDWDGMQECHLCKERFVVMPRRHAAFEFFMGNGAWSYDPETETSEQGRRRCAMELVAAEDKLRKGPYFWHVEPDDHPYDGDAPWDGPVWVVTLYNVADVDEPEVVAAMGGVACDAGDDYLRVVAAELAHDNLDG